jgi:Methylamine utilisation protein MauE
MIYVSVGCRSALVLIFVIACISKVQNTESYRAFHESLGDIGLPSALAVRALSVVIPVAEAVVALLIAVNRTSVWGLAASVGLLASFTAGVGVAKARGRTVRCRCFGESSVSTTGEHILRNAVLAVISIAGMLASLAPAGHLRAAMAIFAIGIGVIGAGLFLRWDELAFLLRPPSRPRAARPGTAR